MIMCFLLSDVNDGILFGNKNRIESYQFLTDDEDDAIEEEKNEKIVFVCESCSLRMQRVGWSLVHGDDRIQRPW